MRKALFLLNVVLIIQFTIGCSDDSGGVSNNNSASTVKDADGNVYHTVKIGTQTWMVENLKTTKYKDGTSIPNISDSTAWNNLVSGAYCNYRNDIKFGSKYGRLYNWYAVKTGKLAPKGWHVPNDTEWFTLEDFVNKNLGYSNSQAKALADSTAWTLTAIIGTVGADLKNNNNSGFKALPGGYRENGFFEDGIYAGWWSSTEDGLDKAWVREITSNCNVMNHADSYSILDGISVRCVKDN